MVASASFQEDKSNGKELVCSELVGTSTSLLYRDTWSRDWQMTRLQELFSPISIYLVKIVSCHSIAFLCH